jgi:quinol monooxygenase YgiN
VPLTVVATITANPGSEDVVEAALRELAGPSRQEAGCHSYALYRSAADPTVFITIEQWESQADLDQHMTTPHIATAVQAVGDHLAKPFEVHPLAPVDD